MNDVNDNAVRDDFIFESDVELGNPPAEEDIPIEAYQGFDVTGVTDEDTSDLAIHNALGALTPADLENAPASLFNGAPDLFNEEVMETPVSRFLMDQIEATNQAAISKNPNAKIINLETSFPKYLQSQWFGEFNQLAANSDEPHGKLITKANGFFFTANESPEDALKSFKIPDERIKELAQYFDMSFFGSTRSRTKNNGNENGFKSYVMHLKDPKNPDAIAALAEVLEAKSLVVQAKLDKSYDLQKATDFLAAKAESIIAEETNNAGAVPFVGSMGRLFLSPTATYAEINEKAPELKDLFSVEPLNVKGNKVTYTGYSESLESYFEDDLKICKLVTKDPQKLPQEELERVVAEKLGLDQNLGHVAATPQEALIQQIANLKDAPENTPSPEAGPAVKKEDTLEGGPTNKKSFQGNKKDNKDYEQDESHFNRRNKNKNNEDDKEPTSLAKIALDAFSKITQATLAALLALVKLLLQSLMMMVKGLLGMASSNVPGQSILPDNPWTTFNNALNRGQVNGPAVNEVENTKNLDPVDAVSDLTKALDNEINMDRKLRDELALSEVKPLDKIALSKEALANLSEGERARLEQDADKLFLNLSDDEKKEYLSKISIPAQHSFDDALSSKLSEPLLYDDRYGVLLASEDKVGFNGQDYGVVSAAIVGGELLYAIAKENDAGQYDIQFVPASELTLKEHNAYRFDNFSNLKNHIHEQLLEKFAEHEGKIEKLQILDRENLKGNEITIAELNDRIQFIDFNQLGYDTSSVSVDELVKDNADLSKALYYSLPQLHQDKTGDLAAPSRSNSHPFFGRLLDVNDLVDIQLANGGINVVGSVIGAYEAESDLYYQIFHDNQFYSIKADQVSLLQPNGGDLTDEQIRLMSAKGQDGKDFRLGSIASPHQAVANKVDLLTQNDEPGLNQSLQYVQRNDVINQGRSNIGIAPLEKDANGDYLGAGKIISLTGYNNEKSHFVTIGETINSDTGMRRAVAVQVASTLTGMRPVSADKNRMVQLDLDDPNIKIESAGFRNEHVKAFALKARDVYQSGSLRRVATVMASFVNEAKAKLLSDTNEPLSIARESYLQNKVAMGLLQEQAGVVPVIPKIDMGLNANLAQSMFHVDAVEKAISNPESLNHVQSQELVTNNPSDLIANSMSFESLSMMEPLSINDLISNYSAIKAGINSAAANTLDSTAGIEAGLPENANVAYQDVDLSQLSAVDVQQGINDLAVVDELNKPSSSNAAPTADLAAEIESIKNPEAQRLATFVGAYISGKTLSEDQFEILDVMSEKNRLNESLNSIKQDVQHLNQALNSFLGGHGPDSVLQFEKLSLDEINSIKSALSTEDNAVQLNNLKEAVQDYSLEYGDHIESLVCQLNLVGQAVAFNELNEVDQSSLYGLNRMVKNEMLEHIVQLDEVQKFVGSAEFIHKADNDLIANALPDMAHPKPSNLFERVNMLDAAFTGNKQEQARMVKKEADLDMSFNNM